MPPRRATPLVGAVVGGRYRLIQLLGSGGTGDVYLAEAAVTSGETQPAKRGRVAIKVLRAELRAVPELVQRFTREAEAGARVRHGNVRTVLEGPFELDGVLCFVMELLVGLDLADTLAYSRTLGSTRAVGIAAGAADGLAAAHTAGVVHRDVKPENIFLVHAADGREAVKLLDFGFAFMAGDEVSVDGGLPPPASPLAVGTPEYMAPEQARGAAAQPAADVYSLGVVLYEMLAGCTPFTGRYPGIALEHAERPVPPIRRFNPGAALSAELEAVAIRALAKAPGDRFPSMSAMRRALLATPEGVAGGR
jgi:serine/threonine-protein kinase